MEKYFIQYSHSNQTDDTVEVFNEIDPQPTGIMYTSEGNNDHKVYYNYLRFLFAYSLLCDLIKIYKNTEEQSNKEDDMGEASLKSRAAAAAAAAAGWSAKGVGSGAVWSAKGVWGMGNAARKKLLTMHKEGRNKVGQGDKDIRMIQEIKDTIEGEVKKGKEIAEVGQISKKGLVDKGEEEEGEGILDKLTNLLFGKATSEDIIDKKGFKSYTPTDRGARELISVTKQELVELRKSEEQLKKQIKQDKLNYMNRYAYLQKHLSNKLNEVNYLEKNTKQTSDSQVGNIQSLKDRLNVSAKSKLDIIRKKEDILEQKRQKDKLELNNLRDRYIEKLNKAFKTEYKRMKYSYERKNKRQSRILFDLVRDYEGDNASILELLRLLKQEIDIPLMIRGKRTHHKRRKKRRTIKRINNPEEGVYSLIPVVGH